MIGLKIEHVENFNCKVRCSSLFCFFCELDISLMKKKNKPSSNPFPKFKLFQNVITSNANLVIKIMATI